MTRKITLIAPEITGKEEVVIVPLFKGVNALSGWAKKLDILCKMAISHYLKKGAFSANSGETLLIGQKLPRAPDHILLLGLGEKGKLGPETTTKVAGEAFRALKKLRFKSSHLLLCETFGRLSLSEFLFAFVKGFSLAQYSFSIKEKSKEGEIIEKLFVMASREREKLPAVATKARIVIDHIKKVRDLVNTPANVLTPRDLAREASSLSRRHRVHCRVYGPKEIEKFSMGAIMSVSKGSRQEPRLIVMHYNRNNRNLPIVCLVGKGVTFDSGGISIKSWDQMDEMKGDMAGGALVVCAIAAAARLKIPLQIVGIVPCVENMPDGSALKPGDIIRTHAGKTIEIISTDAEGRLILADSLAYALKFRPVFIADFATLTGACIIALGKRVAGVMGNNQDYIEELLEAGKEAGEPVWQLPLDETFSQMVKGEIADYKNYAGKDGSTITAAALLGEFVGDTPWVHVDIAGPVWSDNSKVAYLPKGGTGFGVDLTIRFLEKIASRKKPK